MALDHKSKLRLKPISDLSAAAAVYAAVQGQITLSTNSIDGEFQCNKANVSLKF